MVFFRWSVPGSPLGRLEPPNPQGRWPGQNRERSRHLYTIQRGLECLYQLLREWEMVLTLSLWKSGLRLVLG